MQSTFRWSEANDYAIKLVATPMHDLFLLNEDAVRKLLPAKAAIETLPPRPIDHLL